MNLEIFRATAIARMSSPDQLDRLMRVTTARGWVALLTLVGLLTAAVVWGFLGSLTTKTAGTGVVVRTGNMLTVGTLGQGRVMTVEVKVGDNITEGQVVATVGQPSLLEKVRVADAQLADGRKERGRRASVEAANIKAATESYEKQRASLEQQIQSHQAEAKTMTDQVPVMEQLLAKGLVTRQQLLELKEKLDTVENTITNVRSQIVELSARTLRDESATRQSEAEFDSRVTDLQRNLMLQQQELDLTSKVTSPYAGQVIEVSALPGSLVAAGASILTIQPGFEQLEVVAFVPAAHAKDVLPDMDVEVIPSSVQVEEYGFIRGKVTSIADFPSTQNALMLIFQNTLLVQSMAGGGPVHEVHVRLLPDRTTPSGFAWSSKNGAPIHITPATSCAVNVVTREQAPITMVFPYIKKQLGIY